MSSILRLFSILLTLSTMIEAQLLPFDIKPKSLKSDTFMSIKILDSKEFRADTDVKKELSELSALTFYKNKLYALSDKGYLSKFNIKIKNKKIESLTLINAAPLKDKNHKKLQKPYDDSEGLTIMDDVLLISFEDKSRVELFSLDGIQEKKQKIHKKLKSQKNYLKRNKGLEAVAYSAKYGILTAPELSLKGKSKKFHTIYAKKKKYKMLANGRITALEFISKNSLLVLERTFDKSELTWVITLSSLNLSKCKKSCCKQKTLAILESAKDWKIDNFEGLTKLSKNRFLMVSDDNENSFQKTLFVLFKILD